MVSLTWMSRVSWIEPQKYPGGRGGGGLSHICVAVKTHHCCPCRYTRTESLPVRMSLYMSIAHKYHKNAVFALHGTIWAGGHLSVLHRFLTPPIFYPDSFLRVPIVHMAMPEKIRITCYMYGNCRNQTEIIWPDIYGPHCMLTFEEHTGVS